MWLSTFIIRWHSFSITLPGALPALWDLQVKLLSTLANQVGSHNITLWYRIIRLETQLGSKQVIFSVIPSQNILIQELAPWWNPFFRSQSTHRICERVSRINNLQSIRAGWRPSMRVEWHMLTWLLERTHGPGSLLMTSQKGKRHTRYIKAPPLRTEVAVESNGRRTEHDQGDEVRNECARTFCSSASLFQTPCLSFRCRLPRLKG